MERLYNTISGKNLDRLGALSDGLFAIALTLLVLDLHVPASEGIHSERDLLHGLALIAPRLLTWLMSFLTLGIFWVGQQAQLNMFRRSDRNLTWIQITFLLVVSMVPFSTALLAQFITFRTALLAYWLNIFLLGFVLYVSWVYALRAGLVKDDVPPDIRGAMFRRIIAAQTLYAIGAALCAINTYWSIAVIFCIQLNYAIAPRIRFLYRL